MKLQPGLTTIQDIESADLSTLSREDLSLLKRHLNLSFYHTTTSDRASDGRRLKELFAQQEERVTSEIFRRAKQ
jgi:hypothetical protein